MEQQISKIKDLILSNDKSNKTLAIQLLKGKGFSKKEIKSFLFDFYLNELNHEWIDHRWYNDKRDKDWKTTWNFNNCVMTLTWGQRRDCPTYIVFKIYSNDSNYRNKANYYIKANHLYWKEEKEKKLRKFLNIIKYEIYLEIKFLLTNYY